MNTIYVVIDCGYEGIDALTFCSHDKDEIIAFVKERRTKIIDIRKEKDTMDYDSWNAMIDDRYKDLPDVYPEEFSLSHMTPDQVCVQKWDGKKFECACQELGISPDNTWIM